MYDGTRDDVLREVDGEGEVDDGFGVGFCTGVSAVLCITGSDGAEALLGVGAIEGDGE